MPGGAVGRAACLQIVRNGRPRSESPRSCRCLPRCLIQCESARSWQRRTRPAASQYNKLRAADSNWPFLKRKRVPRRVKTASAHWLAARPHARWHRPPQRCACACEATTCEATACKLGGFRLCHCALSTMRGARLRCLLSVGSAVARAQRGTGRPACSLTVSCWCVFSRSAGCVASVAREPEKSAATKLRPLAGDDASSVPARSASVSPPALAPLLLLLLLLPAARCWRALAAAIDWSMLHGRVRGHGRRKARTRGGNGRYEGGMTRGSHGGRGSGGRGAHEGGAKRER